MSNYRRDRSAGGSWFFTVNLADRRQRLLLDHVEALREAFRYTLCRHPFRVEAIVIMPDHLHTVWTLPAADVDYPLRWRLIKTMFTRSLPAVERISASRRGKGERHVWQRRYWEHRLRDEQDFARHIDYIHNNPLKHGYVSALADWPWSSFHRYVRHGVLPEDWAGGDGEGAEFGERGDSITRSE